MTTERLYDHDAYLKEFRARVVDRSVDGLRLYLDRTAFYPSSGGQPHDTGTIAGVPVLDVIDEEHRIAHVAAAPVVAEEADCSLDWDRRFDHMQQHTGQHLLSGVLAQTLGVPTVSFHLGAESSTIDVDAASLSPDQIAAVANKANQIVYENRAVTVSFEAASEALDLRRPSERQGTLRVVSIQTLDRSACGGTHVRATGEIGPISIRKLEKIRAKVRIEFLCGGRAVRRARADYEALSSVARLLSASSDQVPALVAAQLEALQSAEKARLRFAAEVARYRGRELYQATPPGPDGFRCVVRRLASGAIDEELRGLAQGFTSQPRAVFVAAIEGTPCSVLFAVSENAGIHAGDVLRQAVARHGGRGGGAAGVGQGSVPSAQALDPVCDELSGAAGIST